MGCGFGRESRCGSKSAHFEDAHKYVDQASQVILAGPFI